ncbi:MAG: CBS domain-containing protein [Myxococcales bacterium]|nr:CBS domain-containing protein [Myxococcales bacterium]
MRPLREVFEVGEPRLFSVAHTSSVLDVARAMNEAGASAAIVMEGGLVRGIVTEHDMLERVVCPGIPAADTPVTRVMTAPVIGVDLDAPFAAVAELMSRRSIRHILVRDHEKPIAVVTARDLLVAELAERRRYIDDLEHYLYRYR